MDKNQRIEPGCHAVLIVIEGHHLTRSRKYAGLQVQVVERLPWVRCDSCGAQYWRINAPVPVRPGKKYHGAPECGLRRVPDDWASKTTWDDVQLFNPTRQHA